MNRSVLAMTVVMTATLSMAVPLGGTAVAQQNDKARAKKLFKEGKRLFLKKRYRDAIVPLEKARRLWKHRPRWNLYRRRRSTRPSVLTTSRLRGWKRLIAGPVTKATLTSLSRGTVCRLI